MGRHHFPPAQFIGIGTRQVLRLSSDPSTAAYESLRYQSFTSELGASQTKRKLSGGTGTDADLMKTLLLGRRSSSPPKQSLDGPPGRTRRPSFTGPSCSPQATGGS